MLLLLLGLALVMRPVEQRAHVAFSAAQSDLPLSQIEGALGPGIILAVLGGFRTILADFSWIRLNAAWEQKAHGELDALIRLVTTLEPDSVYFWINSARMLAYDVPHWRIDAAGGSSVLSATQQREIFEEQAQHAFELLARARQFHPLESKLHLEVAQIYLIRLQDHAAAGEWFLKASELPAAPYYAARRYADLLQLQGLNQQAYLFLKQLHQKLPNEDPYAQKNIVLERIQQLEASLQLPAGLR